MSGRFHDDEDAVRRLLADLDATPKTRFDAGAALVGGRRRRRRRAVSGVLATALVASVAGVAVAQTVGREQLRTSPMPAQSPTPDPVQRTPEPDVLTPPAQSQRADGSVTVTYQDGTTVTWPGPRRGKQWIADPRPGSAESSSPRLHAWEGAVRERLAWTGSPEAFGLARDPSGAVGYAWFSGASVSALWAQGPEVATAVGPDPCSQWPVSAQARSSGGSCRVIHVDGRSGRDPVVVHQQRGQTHVFSVRDDGTVVAVSFTPESAESSVTDDTLARIALGLPDADPSAEATEKGLWISHIRVSTHCGVRSIRFDKELWIATPPLGGHNPPKGWNDPWHVGSFYVQGDRGVFDDGNGQRATFRLAAEGEADPNEGCD